MKRFVSKRLLAAVVSASIMMSSGVVLADETAETIPEEVAEESEDVTTESEETLEETETIPSENEETGEEIIEEVEESLVTDEAMDVASGVAINATNFPDAVFRRLISEQFDTVSDGVLSQDEIDAVDYIGLGPYCSWGDQRITYEGAVDLTGIEYFEKLKDLCFAYCEIDSVDLSHNTELEWLDCNTSSLSFLDVSNNTLLRTLCCSDCNLTSLDVSNNTILRDLSCDGNSIRTLDLSNNSQLDYLVCRSCNLTSLDLTNCLSLSFLYCEDNNISTILLSSDSVLSRAINGADGFYYSDRHFYSTPEVWNGAINYFYSYLSSPDFRTPYITCDLNTTIITGVVNMYRLYNPNSGEHFYTSNAGERDLLASLGWHDEGIGWIAPAHSNTPVYRLYNENGGEHHYTTSVAERDMLVSLGWNDEGIGWYSDDAHTVPLYRQYNPNAFANNHNYTTSLGENDWLVSIGWRPEGIGWYGIG